MLGHAVAVYYKGFCSNLRGFRINKKEYDLILIDSVRFDCKHMRNWVNGLNVENIQ